MIFALSFFFLTGNTNALYNSLEPTSVTEHLAFYELHKNTQLGVAALEEAAILLDTTPEDLTPVSAAFLELTHPTKKEIPEPILEKIKTLGRELNNRSLKGHSISTLEELMKLPPEEIDVARALLLIEGEKSKTYEAMLDVLALQIKAKLSPNPSKEQLIEAMNQLIFFELGIRFPPHSISEKSIDTYTLLPSVLDSRRGVCLGVSTIYIALAERLNLPLTIITPPGHIYIASGDINIETTARGINIPSSHYLSINLKGLRQRTKREVLGMVLMNQGSKYLCDGDVAQAEKKYEQALLFMPKDPYLRTFYACSLILQDKNDKAERILAQVESDTNVISPDVLVEDLRKKRASKASLQALFIVSDHTRKTQVDKLKALESACKRDPKFQSGLQHLAGAYIDLQKFDLAIETLEKLVKMNSDITSEYMLAALYHERYNDKLAREHFSKAKAIAAAHNMFPEALQELEKAL